MKTAEELYKKHQVKVGTWLCPEGFVDAIAEHDKEIIAKIDKIKVPVYCA